MPDSTTPGRNSGLPDSHEEPHNDIVYPATIPFLLVHAVAVVGVFFVDFTLSAILLCVGLYLARMFALTGGYHRYFSHRSYRTSRPFQFFLAFLGQTSAQRGVIWWAAVHRHHHRHSDTPEDVHSPVHAGFWFSHVGWIFSPSKSEPDYSTVRDLTRYPELRLLNRHPYVPPAILAGALFLMGGWSWLIIGFFLSTVILYHCTFAINSVAHVVGRKRYVTGDESRNNWLLALITLGEGWHNNHHHYQSSTRQGFRWWEIDVTYYVLKALSWVGLVWGLREPPEEVVANERRLGRRVVEKTAHQVAAAFNVERMAEQVTDAWSRRGAPVEQLRRRLERARSRGEERVAELHLPHLPSLEEVREKTREMVSETPSLDEIAERAREILVLHVSSRILEDPGLSPQRG